MSGLEPYPLPPPQTAPLKICGLRRAEELQACREANIAAIGLNFWPKSKRFLDPARVGELGPKLPGDPLRVGVFVEAEPAEVVVVAEQAQLDALQWHGATPVEPYAQLGLPYIWVVRGTPALESLVLPQPAPLWVLLDAAVPGFGGQGVTTDWGWAAQAVNQLGPTPVWLAGGLTVDNAAAALAQVQPAGLDVASGAEVQRGGGLTKDPTKIRALAAICRGRGAVRGAGW